MLFSEIPGLTEVKDSLINSYRQNHIAHAQMFSSVSGGAGLPMALSFATFLLCENKQGQDACGRCSNCQKMSRLVHPDVHFFFPKISAPKANEYDKQLSGFLKTWREFVTESPFGELDDWVQKAGLENKQVLISKEDSRRLIKTVSLKSYQGDHKIIIIWCPENMNVSAANGLLKILEEPPTQTIYLLVTHDYDRNLTTIKSRTQLFLIPPVDLDAISSFLSEKMEIDLPSAKKLAKNSEGNIGRALHAELEGDPEGHHDFRLWMQNCLKRNFSELTSLSESFAKKAKSEQRNELLFSLSLIREGILIKADPELSHVDTATHDFLKKFSNYVGEIALERIYESISRSMGNLSRNASAKIEHLNLSLSICRAMPN